MHLLKTRNTYVLVLELGVRVRIRVRDAFLSTKRFRSTTYNTIYNTNITLTTLPSNLRQATRDCVYFVTFGHVTKMAVTPFDPL